MTKNARKQEIDKLKDQVWQLQTENEILKKRLTEVNTFHKPDCDYTECCYSAYNSRDLYK